jgi:cathepsin L
LYCTGQCGSCWSFAAAESIESYWALATGELEVLSEQHILSCVPNPNDCGGSGGCNGGTAELAFTTLVESGIASEWKYPYLSWYGKNSECHYTEEKVGPPAAKLSGYHGIRPNDYDAVLNALAYVGPLAVNVDASNWHFYESGIYDGCNTTNPDVDHVVQLVGYGITQSGIKYWTMRNSWTPAYGENGYIRVLRDNPPVCGTDIVPQDGIVCDGGPANVTVCGMCGVIYDASFPIVNVSPPAIKNGE